jgi:hypothetical protein
MGEPEANAHLFDILLQLKRACAHPLLFTPLATESVPLEAVFPNDPAAIASFSAVPGSKVDQFASLLHASPKLRYIDHIVADRVVNQSKRLILVSQLPEFLKLLNRYLRARRITSFVISGPHQLPDPGNMPQVLLATHRALYQCVPYLEADCCVFCDPEVSRTSAMLRFTPSVTQRLWPRNWQFPVENSSGSSTCVEIIRLAAVDTIESAFMQLSLRKTSALFSVPDIQHWVYEPPAPGSTTTHVLQKFVPVPLRMTVNPSFLDWPNLSFAFDDLLSVLRYRAPTAFAIPETQDLNAAFDTHFTSLLSDQPNQSLDAIKLCGAFFEELLGRTYRSISAIKYVSAFIAIVLD